jgi:HK97 gp10 family phage protein
MFKITITGADKLKDFIVAVPAELREKTDEILGLHAELIENDAKHICPVRTGKLQNSIFHMQTGELQYIVGTELYYGPYVEYGTSRMMAQPFMRPAVAFGIRSLNEDFKRLMKEL